MTMGRITSSQQDLAFVKVRIEDDTFIETHNGTMKNIYYIVNSVGQVFTTARWSGRLKIKIANVSATGSVRALICESPAKSKIYYENHFHLDTLGGQVIHMAYDPLPAGTYYYEIQIFDGSIGVSVVTDSTIQKAYREGSPTSDWDIESKIMYVTDVEEERPVAIVGDKVDNGVTTVKSGSKLGNIVVAGIEHNISREGDALANGGNILTASWFVEMNDNK